MPNYYKKGVLQRHKPKLEGKKCSWVLPSEFRENEGLATLGLLQSALSNNQVETCLIDFKHVEWADPQPLLCLGLVLAESRLDKKQIILNLGSTDEKWSTSSHRIFLKFLAQQGFLRALANHALFRLESKLQEDVQELRIRLATEPQSTHFLNADCIFARILKVDQLRDDQAVLQRIVEELLREAQDRAIVTAFGAEPLARDMLFQKMRKLLYELILNIAEHSHPESTPTYAGIYARIRGPKPPVESDATAWTELFTKTNDVFGQRNFTPNPYAEWLELFICDIGVGLTAHIADWKEADDPSVTDALRKAQKSNNPLETIAHCLFRNALSRHPRHDANRTAVTGLQHLGHLLAIGGDYCRIYTQKGCWIGNHFPWQQLSTYSRKDIRTPNPLIEPQYAGLTPVSGTAYVFSIQPNHHNISSIQSVCVYPDNEALCAIRTALRTETVFDQMDTKFYDRRTMTSCLPPDPKDVHEDLPVEVMVLRPPRLTSKRDISKWLELVAGTRSERPIKPVKMFVIADLTPFQVLTFRELLLNVNIYDKSQLDLYLVSEDWAVSCLTTFLGNIKFESADSKAHVFFKSKRTPLFSAAKLAVLLRQMDSQIFWHSETEQVRDPFFNGAVDWPDSSDKKQCIRLERYLDFPHALAEPERYRACRRALRRCLALYPAHHAIGADDLVTSLVRDAISSFYTRKVDTKKNTIVVGSIAVTSETVNRLKDEGNNESLQMMIHGDVKDRQDSTSLAAMLWISQLPETEKLAPLQKRKDSHHPWRRIPHTPYIAPLGEQSVSILRYKRRSDGSIDFNNALYGRTPEDTYNDFQRLGILKTGHWKYGSLHDLQTINIRLAFLFSFLELGPLYNWMRAQFELLFSVKNKKEIASAQFLIYPSHPVTDTMLDRIRQDKGFADILPEGGMIPVKFIGMHTVSPLLASHLVAHRIEQLVKDRHWKDWSAVVLDDGTVSGKHLRELTQFLQGLRANRVYTLALLDRTGLPAQEAVFDKFFERHKRLWRWDVPALGNKRDCPLCQGLSIAQTYAHRLPSDRQKKRLEEWMELWKVRDVDTEWHQGGIPSIPLVPPLKITFGVDEKYNGQRVEKHLSINDSTTATSIMLELTRLTTRADVTIKKAKLLEATSPDAAIEMIACQLLLFLDELSLQEKRERFISLLNLIWSRPTVTPAMSLAGLCFTLADHEDIKGIWNYCKSELLPTQKLGELDAILATYILRSRHAYITKESYSLPENASDIERCNYIMLGGGGGLCRIVRDFLVALYRNPAVHDRISTHTTEIRKRLVALMELQPKIDIKKMYESTIVVIQDMRQVEQIMLSVKRELIADIPNIDLIELDDYTSKLEAALELFDKHNEQEGSDIVNNILKLSNALHTVLYGKEKGMVKRVGSQFLTHFKDSDELDNDLVAKIVRSIRLKWTDYLQEKKTYLQNKAAVRRWLRDDGTIVQPDILCSTNEELQELWLYCDSFVRQSLEDTLTNVYHSIEPIEDPWFDNNTEGITTGIKAHLWWRVERDGNYAAFKTANASANQKIDLKQTVNFAGLERAGGCINDVKIEKDAVGRSIAYITLRLPLPSAFIKEEI